MPHTIVLKKKNVTSTNDPHLMYQMPLSAIGDGGRDSLIVADTLAASVVSACFPTDLDTDTIPTKTHPVVKREVLGLKVQSRREKEVIRKRIYHLKVKDERNRLRRRVDELSRQLEELKQGKPTSLSDNLIVFHSVWKDFAIDEREKLLQSEAEQLQLLAAVEAKAFCIEEVREQLARNKKTETLAITNPTQPDPRTNPPFDYTMFRGHLRRAHESYAIVDEIFDFNSIPEGLHISVKRREMDGEIEYFEHRNKFTLPFRYKHTERTFWKLAKLHHRQQDRVDFGEVADPNDTIVVRFRLVQTLTCGATVSVLQRHVGCRFVEDNRTVHVWKTHSEGEGLFRGMHSDETGWVCFQSSLDEETIEVTICVRQAPIKLIISNANDERSEEFHEILQRSVNDDMAEITSELDRLLLEESLAGIEIVPSTM
ncbi:unnamed protein product [Peronospora destructor]|uniref:Uncharacterized protein n=1 Tax=Peronospora destructor TaxID=86335 RepID=A0AAV0TPN2_9STRA|nr:unnamed protein product [Peronospora destructor]